MSKKLTTTLAGASLLAGALFTNQVVSAEETTSTAPQENKQETTTVKETVTKEVVDQAKTDLDKASADVNNKTEEVATAQSNVDTAQSNLDEAQQLINEATDENKEKVANQITDEQTNLSSQESELDNLNTSKEDKEKEIVNQTKVVESAQSDVDKAQSDVNAAEKDVADKQAALDGTNAEQVAKNLEAAKENHANVSNELAQAESNLEQSKKEDAANKQLVDDLTAQKSAADSEQATAKSELDNAQSDVTTKQTDKDAKQSTLDKAQNDFDAINEIVLSDKYIKLLKEYTKAKFEDGDRQQMAEITKQLQEFNGDMLKANKYKANKNDDNTTKYDVNNLSEEMRKELSLFAAGLINDMRDKFGAAHLKVTQSGLDFANYVGERVYQDKFTSLGSGHHTGAIKDFAKQYGLPQGQFYENLTVIRYPKPKLEWTFAELKQRVYDSVIQFMFNGREYDHAHSIAGLAYGGAIKNVESFGVDFAITGESDTATHFLKVSDAAVKRAEGTAEKQFNNKEITNPITKQSIIGNYSKAKSALTAAQSALATAQQNLQQKQAAYNAATAKVDEIAKQLNDAQSKVSMTPELQAKVDKLLNDEKVAKTALDKAQENFDNLSADVKTKQAALDTAKQNLAAAQQTLANRQAVLATETAKLNDLVKELETIDLSIANKQSEIVKTNETIKELTDYLAKLNSADEVYADALAKLNVAKDELAKLQDELAGLVIIKETAETRYNALKAEYDLLVQIEEMRQEHARELQRLLDEQKRIQLNYASSEKMRMNHSKENQSSMMAVANKLPNTGMTNSQSMLAAGLVVSSLGVAGLVPRRKRYRK